MEIWRDTSTDMSKDRGESEALGHFSVSIFLGQVDNKKFICILLFSLVFVIFFIRFLKKIYMYKVKFKIF